jgi:hypothetical protein
MQIKLPMNARRNSSNKRGGIPTKSAPGIFGFEDIAGFAYYFPSACNVPCSLLKILEEKDV